MVDTTRRPLLNPVLRFTKDPKPEGVSGGGKNMSSIITDRLPEQQRVLEESRAGIAVAWTQKAFAEGIEELLKDTKLAREMGERGPEWVRENRSYAVIADQVAEVYQGLGR